MIKHIVMWRLKDTAEGASRDENARKMKAMLLALKDSIAEIKQIEVGMNALASPAAYDVVLYSAFESFDALQRYQKHPEHEKCKEFIGKIVSDRAVVDYEV
ncbi:Dabb family protein [Phormidium sp. CCY1219]|uniref:Dabb family protein n=1 Tax=Phormidium sp. CCY1219 TaxID=2886104 RepID=UPI002D1EA19D|nr:Dabb family protein [Phormidium sp. CCY1219]MEB3829159.1 Dabb family protein [Phormidium sp. CCY1219]